jgi:serine phosphatase RsbU (regulator of sigma subunit)
MKPWLLAGAAGLAALVFLLPRHHDTPWPREKVIHQTRQLASTLGLDLTGWTFAVTARQETDWRRLRRQFPDATTAQWLPSLRYEAHARAPEGERAFWAAFGDNGRLLRFGFRPQEGHPPPRISVEQLPALFHPSQPGRFERWRPGERRLSSRPPAASRKRGNPPGAPGDPAAPAGESAAGPQRRGRPVFYWPGSQTVPAEIRILASGPESGIVDARIDVDIPRSLRSRIEPPGDDLLDTIRGFGAFFFVVVMIWGSFRILGQLGIRRDHLRLAFRTGALLGLLLLIIFFLGGPLQTLYYSDWKDLASPRRNPAGFFFSQILGRSLAIAIPLAAGLLTIRGRHIPAWLGVLGPTLRGQWYPASWRGVLAGMAAAPALAAIPYCAAALVPGPLAVLRPLPELLYHPVPAFGLLSEFAINSMGGLCLFCLVYPWLLRPDSPSRLRYALFVLAGLLMVSQRVGPLLDHGYAAAASLPIWLGASWLIMHRLGLAALLAAWLVSLALPMTGVYLLMPGHFTLPLLQTALVAAVPALGAWFATRRPAPAGDAGDFLAEIERRNHPDTAPQLRSEREHLLSEFALARKAQEGMLPASAPAVPGYSLAARCLPAREVGGDLFDYLELPAGRLGLCVADVSGKGVPAALYMTLTKGMLAAEQDMASGPRDLARALNAQLLAAGRHRTFVTLVFSVLDPATGHVEMVRAGHNPALRFESATRRTLFLKPKGIGLGLTSDKLFHAHLETGELRLDAGDILLLYSDGLTEAMNPASQLYGDDRLARTLARHAHLDAPALVEALLADVREFVAGAPSQDDLTILAVKRLALSPAPAAPHEPAAAAT